MATNTQIAERPVVLAEDTEDDFIFFQDAYLATGSSAPLLHFENGEMLVNYLEKLITEPSPILPGIIVLDIKMPRMNGLETLAWIKSKPALASVPIVILTSSCLPDDKKKALNLGVADFFLKPVELHELNAIVKKILNLANSNTQQN